MPYEHLASVTAGLLDSYKSQLVISPVVPMIYNGKFFQYHPPPREAQPCRQGRCSRKALEWSLPFIPSVPQLCKILRG
ncbi:MAG: hypothetical protein ACYDHX_00435 [Methanothrix sp.]